MVSNELETVANAKNRKAQREHFRIKLRRLILRWKENIPREDIDPPKRRNLALSCIKVVGPSTNNHGFVFT